MFYISKGQTIILTNQNPTKIKQPPNWNVYLCTKVFGLTGS